MKPAYDLKYDSENLYSKIVELERKVIQQEEIIRVNKEKIEEMNMMIESLTKFDMKETDVLDKLMHKVNNNKSELSELTHMINVISKILNNKIRQ